MSKSQNSSSSSPIKGESSATPDILSSDSDETFFRSLYEFIEHEKEYQQCPEEGPDQLRYTIYRSVFNKVIARATVYKKLLLTIKAGYDDIIRTLQRREDEARMAERSLAASASRSKSLMICQRRAAQLRERISDLQRETTELQEEMKSRKSSRGKCTWIPGVTVAESEDPQALEEFLERLEAQRAALLDRRNQCIPLEVKARLDAELQAAEQRRDQLSIEHKPPKVLNKRLRFVSDRLASWDDEKKRVPLEELLGSILENIRDVSVTDEEACTLDAELFEDEEPSGIDEFKFLTDYLDRFVELFESAQYEDAAFHAARSPRGVLRNLHTMEMFEGVKGPPGGVPPLLLFFQALLMTISAGDRLSAALSLQAVRCALQHGAVRLVTHAVTHNKLTSSEDLGDILTEHAQKKPRVADMCLALATVTYEACGLDVKTALSMCRRNLIHGAAEFMRHCKGLTAEDCLWVLCRSPSLSLLQLLTEPQQGQAAILSAGVACSTLLADPRQQHLAVQLLDRAVSRGREVLEEIILEDSRASVDIWSHVASLCSELKRDDLNQAIVSILLDQSGTRVLSPDLEGAQLMEHILL